LPTVDALAELAGRSAPVAFEEKGNDGEGPREIGEKKADENGNVLEGADEQIDVASIVEVDSDEDGRDDERGQE
jgi:hypothetical protein